MKKLIEAWTYGLSYLLGDIVISFYTFFTVAFAEVAYLWASQEEALAIPFTVIFLGYVLNVIVCAWFKGEWEGERKEVLFAIAYVVTFGILFVIGCFINFKMNIIMTVILLATTAVNIAIREWQSCAYFGKFRKDNELVYVLKMSFKKIIYTLSQALVLGGPFVAFAVYLEQIPNLHVVLKVVIPIAYFLCIPLIAYYEDSSSARNIFELAYYITWTRNTKKR